MQCVVTGGNVKVLAKAIHSLSRIGDELYVEPQGDGLALRSVNSSRSAYACFLFAPLFFSRYNIRKEVNFRCKMAIKSVQTVFRSVATLEKTVEKCHIELDEAKDRLTFTLHCKHGLLKTHNLSYQDSESLQAVFDKDSYANVFRAHPRLLVDTVVHFPLSVEEVTVTVSDERMWVRNHVEDEAERSRAMLTELCLASDEFDHFAVKAHHSITFCLKELRGLLAFAESTGLLLSMYLDEPGSPVVLSVTDSVLEGNFVLATLSDDHNLCKNNNKGPDAEQPPPPDDFMNDDIDSYLIAMDTSVAPGPSAANPPTTSLAAARETPSDRHRIRRHSEEEEDGDRLPNKKFRSIFFGSVLPPSPQTSMQPVPTQEVLASNSEDETEAD
ncbi:cell cycle checkpoint control protein RAD9A [Nothobranchius furzeri]|uniref:Cell cycle checkpoint control protein n=2 Tax=Nothobranchius furzeri TaxID=105023 RepID=A0A1A7ZCL1_NOTFU|nr:cell cycle checkpoint control protein RAD9A [Nothobranchius furzeri]KAF7228232.1 RAD9 checkpoint clamp component A [Nothobranchius furzeri]